MSHYFTSSPDSPDYDSPPEDSNPRISPQRRRTGVLKTVGDLKQSDAALETIKIDIPVIDFGTTFTPTLTPGQSRPPTSHGISRGKSPLELPHNAPITPPARSPVDRRTPPEDRRATAGDRPGSSPLTGHGRSSSQAWRAGSALGRHSPGGGMTPEEFVQQRAVAARMPQGYVLHRSVSSCTVDRSLSQRHKRTDSSGRPQSRNSVHHDYSSYLTAREQEHVARVTGGPLIHVDERTRTPDPSIGLIGAIEAREQEKRNIKEGVAGHMVKEAIAQRQTAHRTYGVSPQPRAYSSSPETGLQGGWAGSRPGSMYWGTNSGGISPLAQTNGGGYVSPYRQQSTYQQRSSGYFAPHTGYATR